jgi:hypothetical protein
VERATRTRHQQNPDQLAFNWSAGESAPASTIVPSESHVASSSRTPKRGRSYLSPVSQDREN